MIVVCPYESTMKHRISPLKQRKVRLTFTNGLGRGGRSYFRIRKTLLLFVQRNLGIWPNSSLTSPHETVRSSA